MRRACRWAARWTTATGCALGAALSFAQGAPAPDTPVAGHVLVVPFAPGGGADYVARLIAPRLAAGLRVPVAVENRPGDDGTTGAREVARGPADGSVLLLGSTASLLAPALTAPERMLNPVEDFDPVVLVGTIARFIAVHRSVPANSLDEFVRLARSDPDRLRCGWSDALSEATAREFFRLTGTRFACTDYEGVSAAMRADIASGKVNVLFESTLVPEMQSGLLRPLAVAGPSRSALFPDVRTASEAGISGLEFSAWLALLAPKGVPAPVLARLQDAASAALAAPEVADALRARGYVVRATTAAQARTFLRVEFEQWQRLGVRRSERRSSGGERVAALASVALPRAEAGARP